MQESTGELCSLTPRFERTNVSVALRHPSLIIAFLRGESSVNLGRKLITIETRKIDRLLDKRLCNRPWKAADPGGFYRLLALLTAMSRRRDAYFEPAPGILYALCRLTKPRVVVETGVHFGVSTSFILHALEANGKGRLYSIDLPEAEYVAPESTYTLGRHVRQALPPGFVTGALVPGSLRHRWRLSIGRSQDLLRPLLQELGQTDVFFRDSEHTHDAMTFEFETCWDFIRPAGYLVSDNVDRNASFGEFCQSRMARSSLIEYVGIAQRDLSAL